MHGTSVVGPRNNHLSPTLSVLAAQGPMYGIFYSLTCVAHCRSWYLLPAKTTHITHIARCKPDRHQHPSCDQPPNLPLKIAPSPLTKYPLSACTSLPVATGYGAETHPSLPSHHRMHEMACLSLCPADPAPNKTPPEPPPVAPATICGLASSSSNWRSQCQRLGPLIFHT